MLSKTIGSYRIIEKIAFGGMGVVYKGIHTKLEQFVAIKVLSPQFSSNQNMKSRFLSEAKIQAQLSHPNVVNIMNYIEEDEETYLIMEYIDGETLEDLLQRRNRLSIEEAIGISKGILSALNYMHSKGLAHRDIKPSNIMFNKGGVVKVTDFGITKIIGDDKNTKSGLVGSYTYMSPEQILGEEVGIESDIYSFGITLYRMVTGQVPFKGNTEYSIMKGHLESPRVPPWIINPEIPKKLGKVILRAISRNPGDRYGNTDELLEEIVKSMEPNLFYNTGELIDYKNILDYFKLDLPNALGINRFKVATHFLLAFSLILLLIVFGFTKNKDIKNNTGLVALFSGFGTAYLHNEKPISDVSWEYVISSLANDKASIEDSKRGPYKKKSARLVKNGTPGMKSTYKYTYTNSDDEAEYSSLKNTLKRTNILPVPYP